MILATVCAVAFFSCNKTPEPESEQVESGVRFKAQSSSFQFVKGDQIAVKGAERPFAAFVQGEDVFFIGDVKPADDHYAVYPAAALKYFSPTEPTVAVMTIPVVQKAVKDQIPHALRLAVGATSDRDRCLVFEEKTAYFKFTIGPESGNIRSISVISDSAPLTGDISVMCDGGTDVYPMPGAAYNVCLAATGEYFEPGDYYIAVRPTGATDLDIAFEDGQGRIALRSTGVSFCDPGQVIDLGTANDLVFQSRGIIPGARTLIYQGPNQMNFDVSTLSSKEVEVNVLEGSQWMSVVQTRAVTSPVFRISLKENTGTTRVGTFEVKALDGDSRIIYTLVQYGPAGISDEETLRKSLVDFYESTNGYDWTISLNWCTDASLDQWYGLRINEYGEVIGISMYDNSLSGTLPQKLEGFAPWPTFCLSRNSVEGNIPSYIYRMSSVELTYNRFESISDVEDPEEAVVQALYIYDNQIEGQLPEKVPLISNLSILDARNNKFSGSLPESYGRLLERGGTLRLNGNNLTGSLPESIRTNPKFKSILWSHVLFQNGEGFDFDDVEIYAGTSAYDLDGNRHDASEYYGMNQYTLYVDLTGSKALYDPVIPVLDGWCRQYSQDGFGIVAYSSRIMADIDYIMQKHNPQWQFISDRLAVFPESNVINMLLLDREGRVVLNPVKSGMDDILSFLESQFGPYADAPVPEPPTDEEQPEDGAVIRLQEAAEGNGIDIVLMGDGYQARSITDGTYESLMRETMEYFFEIEPFSSYRHLFNVYSVNVVSGDENALGTSYGEGTSIIGDDEKCFDYAAKALSADRMEDALVIVVINSTEFGGSTYMYAPRTEGDWAGGRSVSYIPKVQKKMDFRGLIQHEAGGHGFAKLADEYVGGPDDQISQSEKDRKRANEKYGWYRNIDFTDDPLTVKWAHILSDERYAPEPEGLYEGALGYGSGVWRPTYTSIMKDNQGAFNAPSREIIWCRIHKLAYGSEWKHDFEAFAEYDTKNRLPIEW